MLGAYARRAKITRVPNPPMGLETRRKPKRARARQTTATANYLFCSEVADQVVSYSHAYAPLTMECTKQVRRKIVSWLRFRNQIDIIFNWQEFSAAPQPSVQISCLAYKVGKRLQRLRRRRRRFHIHKLDVISLSKSIQLGRQRRMGAQGHEKAGRRKEETRQGGPPNARNAA